MRVGSVCVCVALVLSACGGGSLNLAEYAAQAEDLVAEMEAGFDMLDTEWESQAPTAGSANNYWDGRLAIRHDFLEGVRNLDPPDEAEGQHEAALDVFARITAADEALAARVATLDTVTEHWAWVDTPEGRAADAVLEEVFAFCRDSQAEFDATAEQDSLQDSSWVPADVEEVVKVAFGCPP